MAAQQQTRTAGSIRALNRERITEAIVACAREQIAAAGASSLSMRAITRELAMTSSAIYRYFASRDELLTRLIIDSYDSLGASTEQAAAAVIDQPADSRFRVICHAARDWALANPHEFFLIYGSPVPGYQAPTDTIGPATRLPNLLIGLMVQQAGDNPVTADASPAARLMPDLAALEATLTPVRAVIPDAVPTMQVVAGMTSYASLIGAISFELGGQLHNGIADDAQSRRRYFDAQITLWLTTLGWV